MRIVLMHESGLKRIIGVFNPETHHLSPTVEFPPDAFEGSPPVSKASFVGQKRTYYLYREVVNATPAA